MHLFTYILLLSICINQIIGQLAKQKCTEYGKLVYQIVSSPVLAADATPKNESQCGIVETPLIIGGTKAGAKEFPHMAEIGYGKGKWHCGGSIISEKAVLSAAHCNEHTDDGPAKFVRVGILTHEDLSKAQQITIAKRLPHPEYDESTTYNDICLFILESPIKFNEFTRPACLNTDPNLTWERAIVIGFGQIKPDIGIKSDHLLKLQLKHYSREECEKVYKENQDMKKGLLASQFCAGENVDNKDTCQGDSGGPIQVVLKEPYCMYSVIGVVSFGKLCGFADTPGIYTNVSSYVDWIEMHAWK